MVGYKIIVTERLGHFVRVRRHKRKRIDKRWEKKYGYKNIPNGNSILLDNANRIIYTHPSTYQQIADAFKENYLYYFI